MTQSLRCWASKPSSRALPDHPAIKAILAWNAEALTDAKFDFGELTLTDRTGYDSRRLLRTAGRRLQLL